MGKCGPPSGSIVALCLWRVQPRRSRRGFFCWTPESWRHLYVCRTGLSHLSWNPLVGSPHQGVPEDATLEAEGSLVFSLSTVPVMHPPLAVRNVAI